MGTYAVVQESDDLIVNTVDWDGVSEWSPMAGLRTQEDLNGEYSIGGTLTSGGGYTPPSPLPDE